VALAEHMNLDELKVLATPTKTRAPARKAELVEHILTFLEGDRLRTVWQGLDDLQKAAVAEVVHSGDTTFPAARFRAKYGRLPDFGAVSRGVRDQPPTALRFFFYAIERGGGVMPDDLKERLTAFVPPPVAATVESLEELPAAYDQPFERWNARTKKQDHGTEPVPLTVRETERSAQRELLSVLRLVDAGKVAVSTKLDGPGITLSPTPVGGGESRAQKHQGPDGRRSPGSRTREAGSGGRGGGEQDPEPGGALLSAVDVPVITCAQPLVIRRTSAPVDRRGRRLRRGDPTPSTGWHRRRCPRC
jgi:hypothetical protein